MLIILLSSLLVGLLDPELLLSDSDSSTGSSACSLEVDATPLPLVAAPLTIVSSLTRWFVKTVNLKDFTELEVYFNVRYAKNE